MNTNDQALWDKVVAFHGHECPGLAMGFRAALYAAQLLGLDHSQDDEVVCITENDACGVDAIQVMLGCSVGKGNLLFHIRGKQAYSFYDRSSGKSVRLVLKERPAGMSREEALRYLREQDARDLFLVKPTVLTLPEPARIFDSYVCESCGEVTGANWIRISGGKKLCLDCCKKYDRFDV